MQDSVLVGYFSTLVTFILITMVIIIRTTASPCEKLGTRSRTQQIPGRIPATHGYYDKRINFDKDHRTDKNNTKGIENTL